MNTNQDTNTGLPLRQDPNAEKSSADTSTFEQRLSKLRDQMAARETHLKKSQSQAHFAVGRIVMRNPALRGLIAPHLEPHLGKMGSARKAVDDYDASAAEIVKLKALRH